MTTTLSIIVAVASNNAIGKNNDLLCHLPGDLQRFKQLTLHHPVIMGHKTFLSLPNGALPMRKNIVLSRNVKEIDGCFVVDTFEKALALCSDENQAFIIGGGTLYEQALPLTNKLYITHIHADIDGDTYFPEVDYSQWNETFRQEMTSSDKCPYNYSFVNYERT